MNVTELTADQQKRYQVLCQALEEENLAFRPDSDLSWDFIFHDQRARVPDLQSIILKMKKAKYLHEYCNFELGYNIAKNTVDLRSGLLPREDWLALVRKCVLMTTTSRRYPKTWPWDEGISAEDWKIDNDLTAEIVKKKRKKNLGLKIKQ